MTISGRRSTLFKRHEGICLWCEKRTRLVDPFGGVLPNDAATIDHLINKAYRPHPMQSVKVLACYRCNQKRSQNECAHKEKNTLSEQELAALVMVYENWRRGRDIREIDLPGQNGIPSKRQMRRYEMLAAKARREARGPQKQKVGSCTLLTCQQYHKLRLSFEQR